MEFFYYDQSLQNKGLFFFNKGKIIFNFIHSFKRNHDTFKIIAFLEFPLWLNGLNDLIFGHCSIGHSYSSNLILELGYGLGHIRQGCCHKKKQHFLFELVLDFSSIFYSDKMGHFNCSFAKIYVLRNLGFYKK